MKATNIKGALLEYIVRNLLKNCGFTNVKADKLYSFERGGLFYVNGKGAAHDADVIMNPPIQMPFSYPTQLIFECKAHRAIVGLPIVRNALGLRNDINDFEIVTKDSLLKRQNNHRATYAIESRRRFLFQIGVASINDFSKPAIEFAANNKIPLLSLSWFLDRATIDNLNSIDQELIDSFSPSVIKNLYDFLKDRDGDLHHSKYQICYDFLREDNIIGDIVTVANTTINYSYVGLLETGDMVFLFARTERENNILNQLEGFSSLKAEIHWFTDRPNVWRLKVMSRSDAYQATEFDFFLPNRILRHWKTFNFDKTEALNLKQRFFSKIFVFNHGNNPDVPFSVVNIDNDWLDRIRIEQEDE